MFIRTSRIAQLNIPQKVSVPHAGNETFMGFRKPAAQFDGMVGQSRPCALAVLSLGIAAVFLFDQVMLKPISYLDGGFHWPVQSLESDAARTQDDIPPRLSDVVTRSAGPIHLFTVPHVLSYYADILPNNHTKLYLITSGIMMRVSRRNLNAVACQVGDDVYPSSLFITEVLHCEIPRPLRPGERLVAVLAWDDQLKRAAEGPVTLITGVVATISAGDIEKLPNSAVLRGNLTQSNRDGFRVVRSDVHFGPSDNLVAKNAKYLPRYQLCLMTMVAPNSHMLTDWANYHRRIGVDHVYIFDNGAKRDLEAMFQGRRDAEVISWPYHKSQLQAVSMFLFAARARCERVMLEDSDEYPMFGLGNDTSWTTREKPLIRYARKAEENGFLHYKLLHLVMVNSGYLHRPKGEVPMNFIHRRRRQTFRNGKSVCYTDQEWQAGAVHQCGQIKQMKPPVYQVDIHNWGEQKMTPEDPDDAPFLMHFRDRSWEEYIEKWDAGRVAGRLVADEKAGSMSLGEPDEDYMQVNPEYEYTHFRDTIYKRVLKEGTLDEQIIVQTKDGKRCEKRYKIDKSTRQFVEEQLRVNLPVDS